MFPRENDVQMRFSSRFFPWPPKVNHNESNKIFRTVGWAIGVVQTCSLLFGVVGPDFCASAVAEGGEEFLLCNKKRQCYAFEQFRLLAGRQNN